jgi:DNA modification methylase
MSKRKIDELKTDKFINIYSGDSLIKLQEWAEKAKENEFMFDAVITSPPYNGKFDYGKEEDDFKDDLEPEVYIQNKVKYFKAFDKTVSDLIIWNQSYFSGNPYLPTLTVASIIQNTNWTLIDTISWHKKAHVNPPKNLTRTVELIYVFAKKSDKSQYGISGYSIDKKDVETEENLYQNYINVGQKSEHSKKNEVGSDMERFGCETTAVFSTELVDRLLNIYCKKEWKNILDPYAGTGTTGISCIKRNLNFTGLELSRKCCQFMSNLFSKYLGYQVIMNDKNQLSKTDREKYMNDIKERGKINDILFKTGDKVYIFAVKPYEAEILSSHKKDDKVYYNIKYTNKKTYENIKSGKDEPKKSGEYNVSQTDMIDMTLDVNFDNILFERYYSDKEKINLLPITSDEPRPKRIRSPTKTDGRTKKRKSKRKSKKRSKK